MEKNINIKRLYQPVQPIIRPAFGHVKYQEFKPDIRLSQYIYCYWELKTEQQLEAEFHYRVVADGCMDIYFELNNPIESYVIGFSKNYTEFPLDTTFHYIGIRFYPAMFPLLFHINASELTDRYELLELILPEKAAFIKNHFNPTLDLVTIQSLLDHFYLNRINQHGVKPDFRFFSAMDHILKNSGNITIEGDLNTGISSRQLRRLFAFYVGDSTKTFCKVIRFQNILYRHPQTENKEPNAFLDFGYYDQAHFIKEFKTMYGDTPKNALKK
ncbi:AraC family transcriptional regulator [Flavobacterium cerinum]|uniref:Helix-turn-helix domain-containing protein n=1 Tax=Flavobacterium cerinum TaxID=2502784 RepID=A0ABY5ISC3_9FLAO|nr:helix-turn-helix domain-containing protein [Flavobacterium cerinum]UUC44269.1 helix-turn-helix domain-containing protein [Flavobacterium cerinum]